MEIVDMGTDGEGIGRKEGYTLFVKDALVGDVIRAKVIKTKKRFGYARLLEVLMPSPWRVEPVCPCARQCGGCQLQHCSYEKQLEWKEKKVADCITRIGGIPVVPSGMVRNALGEGERHSERGAEKQPEKGALEWAESHLRERGSGDNVSEHVSVPLQMEPILRMDEPFRYRNKAQYPVGYDREGRLVAGFYAGRTHAIIPNTDCAIQHPCNQWILEVILDFMEEYQIPAYREDRHIGLVRHILIRVGKHTGDVMVCLVINGEALPHQEELVKRILCCPINRTEAGDVKLRDRELAGEHSGDNGTSCRIKSICLNINTEQTNRILGDTVRVLYGQSYIEDTIGEIRYQISPLSFYQVNPEQTVKLYETALEYADLKGGEIVWDLYCGIGTISLFLAQKAAKVCGVEIVPQAIEDARRNAELNGIINTEFFVGAAEDVVPEQYEKSGGALRADVVTIDPPRKGCDERLLETVVQMQPGKIVYVSCDPATLARDLKYLCGHGYELKRVRACDMFGGSAHVECVCLLHRTDS